MADTGERSSSHVCVAYRGRAELVEAVASFLRVGVERGERVQLIASGPSDALAVAAEGMTGVEVRAADDVYEDSDGVRAYVRAAAEARRDGFTGLRVAAEVTDLVADDARRDAFVRYEHRIDREMAGGLPFAALCAYDVTRLGPDAVDELACVHPESQGDGSPFHLFAADRARLRLAGEVDGFSARGFAVAATRVAGAHAGVVDVDCRDLRFADHVSLLALDRVAHDHGLELRLCDAPPIVHRVSSLLTLEHVGVA